VPPAEAPLKQPTLSEYRSAGAFDAMPLTHTAHLTVHEERIEAFRERVRRHAETSRAEPGCLTFDFYQDTEAPGAFLLFEVYRDKAALEAHRASAHFLAFRRDVDHWVISRQWWYWSPVSVGMADISQTEK